MTEVPGVNFLRTHTSPCSCRDVLKYVRLTDPAVVLHSKTVSAHLAICSFPGRLEYLFVTFIRFYRIVYAVLGCQRCLSDAICTAQRSHHASKQCLLLRGRGSCFQASTRGHSDYGFVLAESDRACVTRSLPEPGYQNAQC